MLSDPRWETEFRDYYRTGDQITVYASNSANTILIVEDRSPAYPHAEYLLLQRTTSGWARSELDVRLLPLRPGPPVDKSYPRVVGFSDTKIWFEWHDWSK